MVPSDSMSTTFPGKHEKFFCKEEPLTKNLMLFLQFLKQMYVLVLGLDVLGNPFGLIRGLSEGVEAFFYEPFQVTHHSSLTQVTDWMESQ